MGGVGYPNSRRKSPGRSEYQAIWFERGVTHDKELEQWADRVYNLGARPGAETSIGFRKDVILEADSEAGQFVIACRAVRCYMPEFQALPDLNANANAAAIPHLKPGNEGWMSDVDVVEPQEPKSTDTAWREKPVPGDETLVPEQQALFDQAR